MIEVTYMAQDEHHILVESDTTDKINAVLTDAEMRKLFRVMCEYYGDGNV
jgi:hypothetical protein